MNEYEQIPDISILRDLRPNYRQEEFLAILKVIGEQMVKDATEGLPTTKTGSVIFLEYAEDFEILLRTKGYHNFEKYQDIATDTYFYEINING